MSVSHGYSTIGGIEYGGGCEEKTKKDKISHQLGKLMGYGDAHQFVGKHCMENKKILCTCNDLSMEMHRYERGECVYVPS